MRFPEDTTITAGEVLVIAVYTTSGFFTTYGFYPDFDTYASHENSPAMGGTYGMAYNLNDVDEMIIFYYWDGSSDLVQDIDYLGIGIENLTYLDKTGVIIDGPDGDSGATSAYLKDTAVASQPLVAAPGNGQSLKRTDFNEGTETLTGRNGMFGHDETSEDYNNTFEVADSPTPGTL
ncbi:MAG TPA: hypothetical protein VMZ05_01775 [Spirochaetota bacterium]|nr:hypothetical protein [Spirochaetota bacterium]